MRVLLDDVFIVGKRRTVDLKAVQYLAESMREIGLQTPITVRVVEHAEEDGRDLGEGFALVAGRHRLEAAKLLGWEEIECVEVKMDDREARLWEIAENLCRAELTVQQRADQIAEWVQLTEEKRELSDNLSGKSRGRPESGAAAASRELGLGEREVQRAVKIASIEPEAKAAAREAGLDDNQSALLKVASAPKEEQVAKIRELHADREIQRAARAINAEQTEARRAQRNARIAASSNANAPLPQDRKYPIILADPPWKFNVVDACGVERAAANHYPTMALDAICALPVSALATDDAVLFMWTTAPHLQEAFEVLCAWGFDYTTHLAWVKHSIGLGYWVRNQHELLLVARRGSPPTPAPNARPSSVITAPRREHSRKPDEAYEVIERMYPELPK